MKAKNISNTEAKDDGQGEEVDMKVARRMPRARRRMTAGDKMQTEMLAVPPGFREMAGGRRRIREGHGRRRKRKEKPRNVGDARGEMPARVGANSLSPGKAKTSSWDGAGSSTKKTRIRGQLLQTKLNLTSSGILGLIKSTNLPLGEKKMKGRGFTKQKKAKQMEMGKIKGQLNNPKGIKATLGATDRRIIRRKKEIPEVRTTLMGIRQFLTESSSGQSLMFNSQETEFREGGGRIATQYCLVTEGGCTSEQELMEGLDQRDQVDTSRINLKDLWMPNPAGNVDGL